MKRAIAAILVLTFIIVCFSGCNGEKSAAASIASVAKLKSYETQSTVMLEVDVNKISWLNSTAHKIITSMSKAPFTMTTKVVNSGDMAGKALIGIQTSDLSLECYYEYDFRKDDNLQFRIVIPTKNFEQYFYIKPDAEYISIDVAKSGAFSKYLPVLRDLHEEYKIFKYPNMLYAVLMRGEWTTEGDTYKLAANDEFFKKQILGLIDEAYEKTKLLATLRSVYNLSDRFEEKDVKATFARTIEPLVNTRFVAQDGMKYEIDAAMGRRVDAIRAEGKVYLNINKIISVFGSRLELENAYIPLSIKTETKFLSRNGAKIKEKYENAKDVTAAVDDFWSGMRSGKHVPDKTTIFVDEMKLGFQPGFKPLRIEGQTLVAAQIIAPAIGATVQENEEKTSITISKGDTVVTVREYEEKATVNGEEVMLGIRPSHYNDVYFIPLGFLVNSFGMEISPVWEGENVTFHITSK